MPSINLPATNKSNQSAKTVITATQLNAEFNVTTLKEWQTKWDAATTDRETYNWFPSIANRINKDHTITINFFTIQALSGHGFFSAHLYKLKAIRDARCSTGESQTFEHLSQNCNQQQVEQIVNASPVVLYNTDKQNLNNLNTITKKLFSAREDLRFTPQKMTN